MRLSHAIAVLILFGGCDKKPIAQDETTYTTGNPLTTKENLKDLSARVLKSVGTVLVEKGGRFVSIGSGFFISEDGQFVTNWHVIEGHEKFKVEKVEGGQYTVSDILYSQPNRDLAVLQVKGKGFIPLKVSENVNVGEPVAIIGSPHGLGGSVTEGIVSAKRNFGDMELGSVYNKDTKCIQTTAAISPGSSGSAIVSIESGSVIGVATFFKKGGQALNFGISSKHIFQLLASATRATDITVNTNPTNNGFKRDVPEWKDPAAYREYLKLTNEAKDVVRSSNQREAINILNRAINLAKENVGTDHPDYADALIQYSLVRIYNDEIELAEPTLMRGLGILEKYDHKSWIYARALRVTGDYFKEKEQWIESIDNYKKSLKVYSEIEDQDHAIFAVLSGLMADSYRGMKNYDKAISLTKSALNGYKELSETDKNKKNWIANCHGELAGLYYDTESFDRAIYEFKMAGKIYRELEGENGPNVERILSGLGNAYYKSGNKRMGKLIWNSKRKIEAFRKRQGN